MTLTCNNWANKAGTSNRECNCGSWKTHWINQTEQSWPEKCSVDGCNNPPTLGAHIYNPSESGEYIAPFCDACNKKSGKFNLKNGVRLVSANKQKTCS